MTQNISKQNQKPVTNLTTSNETKDPQQIDHKMNSLANI